MTQHWKTRHFILGLNPSNSTRGIHVIFIGAIFLMSSIQASNLLTWFCVLFEGLRVLVGMGFLTHRMLAYPAWPTRTVTLCYIVEKRDKQTESEKLRRESESIWAKTWLPEAN